MAKKNGTHGASWGPRSKGKESLEQTVAPDQELIGAPEASRPQEPIGLLEIKGPPELDGGSGQMGPLEKAGALDQEPVGLLWGPWGPLRLDVPQIESQWGTFGGHGVPLETSRPSWRPLGLLELAGAVD